MVNDTPQEEPEHLDRDEVGKALRKAIAKRRGYADHFDWYDKATKEWGIIQTFKEEIEADHGPLIASGNQHPGGENLPPDYQFNMHSGEVWAVEVTELVSQEAIALTKKGQNVVALWPEDELTSKFREIVSRKDTPKKVGGGPYDRYLLLVHVDELMLTADRFSTVLGTMTFETSLIDEIYVLVSYDPVTQRNPLLRFAAQKRYRSLPDV